METEAQIEIPRYKCHKEVWALKIAGLKYTNRTGDEEAESDGSMLLTPADDRYSPFIVDAEYVQKHKPKVGGYYVVYKDGYKSFSPADAFEEGYSLVEAHE